MFQLPPTMLQEIDSLVATGVFASREVAVVELVRLGLDVFKSRSRPPLPPRPPAPPGRNEPGDDRPISVDPSDVNWME